ncbi:hypothetical protein CEN45_08485 [Fischerella thermalis CCMEE 5198]|uniref:thioesterase II family protein n=1 Tax=Fischerella thermalis TaxID=372787 RepID=UPI000C7FD400|nr:thioesterase domain-containing protein [Fischerella thermalis]PMB02411.1 hypothetical protein CI594_07590 [Fischerella thermalis CCMEE 5196]PMB24300.1 hypothetical protein CEN45_08485 [Fischerella thermalis CCMEE 5198]
MNSMNARCCNRSRPLCAGVPANLAVNGTPQDILDNAELMELLLPILRADFAVTETYDYIPEPPLNCPITAFGGLQDQRVSIDDLEAWRTQTESTFVLKMFPGDHFFLHSAQSLLLHTLAERLSESQCTGLTKPRNG